MSRAEVAVHEAGHVVFAVVGGLSVRYATVVPDWDSRGHIRTAGRRPSMVWCGLLVDVAGCAAVASGSTHRARVAHAEALLAAESSGDLLNALTAAHIWLQTVGRRGTRDEAHGVILAAASVACALLHKRSWAASVDRVAAGLMEYGTLSGRACRARVGVAMRAPEAMARDSLEHALRRR